MQLPTSADLVRAFVADLSAVLNVDSPTTTTVPRMFFIAGSDSAFSWLADLDGFLVAIQDDGAAGATVHAIALSKFATTDFAGVSRLFPQIIYVQQMANPSFISGIRFPVRKHDRLWFANGSASPFRVVLWFET